MAHELTKGQSDGSIKRMDPVIQSEFLQLTSATEVHLSAASKAPGAAASLRSCEPSRRLGSASDASLSCRAP